MVLYEDAVIIHTQAINLARIYIFMLAASSHRVGACGIGSACLYHSMETGFGAVMSTWPTVYLTR